MLAAGSLPQRFLIHVSFHASPHTLAHHTCTHAPMHMNRNPPVCQCLFIVTHMHLWGTFLDVPWLTMTISWLYLSLNSWVGTGVRAGRGQGETDAEFNTFWWGRGGRVSSLSQLCIIYSHTSQPLHLAD